jgi:hypothetical protein
MDRLRTGIVGIIAGLALLGGCTKTVSDETLATNIKAALYSDQTTKPANIGVAVKQRVVTLTGDVPSSDVALEAMKIANSTVGVSSVNDQLTVNGVSAANQPPPPAPGAPDANTPPVGGPGTVANPTSPAAPPSPGGAAPSPYAPPVEAPAQPVSVTIPAGEQVAVRTIDAIDSKTNETGQQFRATLSSPLVSHGRTIVPAGADATLLLTQARDSGRVQGRPVLEVRLVAVRHHGRTYRLDSSVFSEAGASRGKQTAVRTGIGAAAGAVIGAIAGGGKGAAIGTAAGGGAGFGSDFFTHGPRVHIPSESILQFRLEAPLTITER